jgi:alpha-L-fucosidase
MQTELRELLGNYGTIDLLWFDWDGREPQYDQASTYPLVRSLQPRMVINNRLDLAPGNNDRQILSTNADYYTPEQHVGSYDDQRPWESCMTLSSRNQWAWGGPKDGVKSLETCLTMLLGCAGGDGNLLLNVGPMPTGEIPPDQAARLRQIGTWLEKYGESIYGTRGGPYKPGDYGVSTRRGRTVYVHVRNWDEPTLKLPALPAKVVGSRVVGGGVARVAQTAEGIELEVKQNARHAFATIVALELDSEALLIPAMAVPAPVSLALRARATASNTYQGQPEYAPGKAVDGKAETRWATDSGTKSAWLELDLGTPQVLGKAIIHQAYPELRRIKRFAIEYWDNDKWTACHQGTDPGEKTVAIFTPVTTRRVRLNITECTDGPTLWEFGLFPPVAGSGARH